MADRYFEIPSGGKINIEFLSGAAILTQGISSFENIIREVLRAGATNPFVGIASMIIISDILYKNKIITNVANDFILALGTAFTASNIISDVLGGGILKPSATTLVYGADQMNMTAALMSGLTK